jgi:hypothetical protein
MEIRLPCGTYDTEWHTGDEFTAARVHSGFVIQQPDIIDIICDAIMDYTDEEGLSLSTSPTRCVEIGQTIELSTNSSVLPTPIDFSIKRTA